MWKQTQLGSAPSREMEMWAVMDKPGEYWGLGAGSKAAASQRCCAFATTKPMVSELTQAATHSRA